MEWFVGPWVWDTSKPERPTWRPPAGCSGLDLRTMPAQSTRGGDPKMSLFFGSLNENRADYISLGIGSWSDLKPTAKQRALIPSRKGYTPSGDTLREIVLDLLCGGADPLGLDCHKPLMPTAELALEVCAADQLHRVPFAWGERHTSLIRDMLRADFKTVFEATRNDNNKRIADISLKMLDATCEKYRIAKTDWQQLVPVDLLANVPGPLPHETTITDNFNRANGAIGSSSEGWSWTNVGGCTWSILGNAAQPSSASGWGPCQAASNLSSTDHYSQVKIVDNTGQYMGPAVRVDGSAVTFYQYSSDTTGYLFKLVSGTQTVVTSSFKFYVLNDIWKCSASGSTIKGYVNGTQILSATDTGISSGLRAGIAKYDSSSVAVIDDFSAADLATAATISPSGSCTATGSLAKKVFKVPSGSTTGTGSLAKQARKVPSGSVTGTGSLVRLTAKAATGSLTPLGTVAKQARKVPAGTTTATGSLAKQASKPLAGASTPTGAVAKQANKSAAGSTTATGTETNRPAKSLAGSSAASGAVTKQTNKALAGSSTPSGAASFARSAFLAVSGILTAAGSLAKRAGKRLAGWLSAAGSLTTTGGSVPVPPVVVRGETFHRTDPTRKLQRNDPVRKLQRTDPARSFRRANPVSAQIQYQTRTKKAAEVVSFPFDFSNFPEVLAGETLSTPSVPAVSGLTIGTPAITGAVVDGIPAGQGLSVTISGGTAGTDYTVTAYVNTSGGATRAVTGVVAVR